MGMGGGGKGGAVSEINVTPLIDVLLVLLIIFMVIVPVTPRGLDALIPQPPKTKSNDRPIQTRSLYRSSQTAVEHRRTRSMRLPFNKTDIEPKLVEIYSTRQTKIMFVKGDPDLDFSKVADVIDLASRLEWTASVSSPRGLRLGSRANQLCAKGGATEMVSPLFTCLIPLLRTVGWHQIHLGYSLSLHEKLQWLVGRHEEFSENLPPHYGVILALRATQVVTYASRKELVTDEPGSGSSDVLGNSTQHS